MERDLTCICCPLGCQLHVTVQDGEVTVSGNTCPRGAEYGKKEVTDPRRVVTSSVPVAGGELPMVSVKTAGDIPKGKIEECMKEIHALRAQAPIQIGDVLLENCAQTGVSIVATKEVEKNG